MSTVVSTLDVRRSRVVEEARKLPAFLRRDVLTTLSYRASFLSDIGSLATQALLFYFVNEMVDQQAIPAIAGQAVTYLQFAVIGIALSAFIQLGLGRVSAAIRAEQMMGTLDPMLTTPTSPSTIQLGLVMFDVVYIPVRTAVFLGLMATVVGVHFEASGIVPALVVLLVFMPFVWGLGILGAAAIMTFRRGGGLTGLLGTLLALVSGAYFPLALLPSWLRGVAEHNPISTALDQIREALIGGTGWAGVGTTTLQLVLASCISLTVGMLAFRLATARERRLGTLGFY